MKVLVVEIDAWNGEQVMSQQIIELPTFDFDTVCEHMSTNDTILSEYDINHLRNNYRCHSIFPNVIAFIGESEGSVLYMTC